MPEVNKSEMARAVKVEKARHRSPFNRSPSPQSERDDVSTSLAHFYLKEAANQLRFAKQEQAELLRTLQQMEKEDVPASDIEEFKKA